MFFQQLSVGPMQNLVYLLGCEQTKQAAVIDCGFESERILAAAEGAGYRISKILLTHVHYDHSGAADALAHLTGAPICMNPESEWKRDESPARGMWVIPEETQPIRPGEKITIGALSGTIIATPGHQQDHLSFIFDPYLFAGDALFIDGCGRTDLPDSDPAAMQKTLQMIATELPDHLVVCPGHDYGPVPMRTLAEEKRSNRNLRF